MDLTSEALRAEQDWVHGRSHGETKITEIDHPSGEKLQVVIDVETGGITLKMRGSSFLSGGMTDRRGVGSAKNVVRPHRWWEEG